MLSASPLGVSRINGPREFQWSGAGTANLDGPMKVLLLMLLFFTSAAAQRKPLAERIGRTAPEALRTIEAVHAAPERWPT